MKAFVRIIHTRDPCLVQVESAVFEKVALGRLLRDVPENKVFLAKKQCFYEYIFFISTLQLSIYPSLSSWVHSLKAASLDFFSNRPIFLLWNTVVLHFKYMNKQVSPFYSVKLS